MTQCKMWEKPFDDPTYTRVADMTPGNWASRLVNKCGVKRRQECFTTDRQLKPEEKQTSWKSVAQTFIRTAYNRFELLNLQKFHILIYHHVFVFLLMLESQAQLSF